MKFITDQRIQFTPSASQQQNELIYTLPMNIPIPKTEIPMYPPMVPYPPVPPAKKPLSRNSGNFFYTFSSFYRWNVEINISVVAGGDMNFADSQPYRPHKDMIYLKDPPPINPPVIPQPNAMPTNIYPCFNNSYTSISPPLYYHPYDYSGPCYPSCPELPSYADNMSPPAYQMPHIVPLPYAEEMYQSNQFICQPMIPAGHNWIDRSIW